MRPLGWVSNVLGLSIVVIMLAVWLLEEDTSMRPLGCASNVLGVKDLLLVLGVLEVVLVELLRLLLLLLRRGDAGGESPSKLISSQVSPPPPVAPEVRLPNKLARRRGLLRLPLLLLLLLLLLLAVRDESRFLPFALFSSSTDGMLPNTLRRRRGFSVLLEATLVTAFSEPLRDNRSQDGLLLLDVD